MDLRKRFWKQCAIKRWSSPPKALLRVPRDSSGPKNNWVDSWNRSSPSCREKSLQCRAPTRPPLLRGSGTPNVPTTPNNTCLHKSGFPLRGLWGCRQHLMPRGLPGTTRGLGEHPPRAASSPASVHHYHNKRTQGLKVRGSLQPRDPTISREKPPLPTRPLAAESIT